MRLVIVLVLAVCLGSSAVRADTTATTSIAQLMVLEPGDGSYKLFHGAVWLDVDKANTNYRWGGLQCKGRELSDTSIQLLFAAFPPSKDLSLSPHPSLRESWIEKQYLIC